MGMNARQHAAFQSFTVPPGEQTLCLSTGSRPPLRDLRFAFEGMASVTVLRISGTDGSTVATFYPPATPTEVTRHFKANPVGLSDSGEFVIRVHNPRIDDVELNVGLIFKEFTPRRRRIQVA